MDWIAVVRRRRIQNWQTELQMERYRQYLELLQVNHSCGIPVSGQRLLFIYCRVGRHSCWKRNERHCYLMGCVVRIYSYDHGDGRTRATWFCFEGEDVFGRAWVTCFSTAEGDLTVRNLKRESHNYRGLKVYLWDRCGGYGQSGKGWPLMIGFDSSGDLWYRYHKNYCVREGIPLRQPRKEPAGGLKFLSRINWSQVVGFLLHWKRRCPIGTGECRCEVRCWTLRSSYGWQVIQ